jgi:hypothetical protein
MKKDKAFPELFDFPDNPGFSLVNERMSSPLNAYSLLLIAYCLLLIAYCLLPIDH